MFFSCQIHVSEWFHTLQVREYQGNLCSKEVGNLKFKWLQLDSKSQPLRSWSNTQSISQSNQMIGLCCDYLSVRFIWMYILIMYAFQSKSTPYSCLSEKEVLSQNRCNIWSWNDCNSTRTHNQLVCNRTLNHLPKLPKRLSCVVSYYLYGACDCMFLPYHIPVSEWNHTLQLCECQATLCSKQVGSLRFKWLQLDSEPQPLSL